MKKISFASLILFIMFLVTGCGRENTLLVLNWGEYINEDVVARFEEKYGVSVIIDIGDSNELFYSKVKSGTTVYDLVIPSEYMVDKMVSKDLLQKINFDLLKNYDPVNNPYLPGVKGIMDLMFEGFDQYVVPYFWGTFGLMYNKRVEGLEEAVTTHSWDAYFNENLRPKGVRIGMYDVARFAYAAALLANNKSPNLADNDSLELARTTLKKLTNPVWQTDLLKKKIAADNLDLAFVYTGDLLDTLYTDLGEGKTLEEIQYDIYIPDNTIAFLDSFVIPKKARHVELAHKFIDFFLDPINAYDNASIIGYCTPLVNAYQMIVNPEPSECTSGDTECEANNEWLTQWAYATSKYYPLPAPSDPVQFKGVPLASLNQDFLRKIDLMIYDVKG
jgi:spermidine/putrescine-binding protein